VSRPPLGPRFRPRGVYGATGVAATPVAQRCYRAYPRGGRAIATTQQTTDEHGFETELSDALQDLLTALSDPTVVDAAVARAAARRHALESGTSFRDILEHEPRPLLVELVRDHLEAVSLASAALRRAEAAGLYAEGLTMQEIADAFGVTRQRISAVLSRVDVEPPAPPA
jgi:DNA-directed RNA polymerase specialized sigma24 family protein